MSKGLAVDRWLRRGHRAVMTEAVVGFLCREEPLWVREKEPKRDMKRRALCQTSNRHSPSIAVSTFRTSWPLLILEN